MSCLRLRCSSLILLFVVLVCGSVRAETLAIDFRKVRTDPLVDYVAASSPGDRSLITQDGLRVLQVGDRPGAKTEPREIGIKTLLSGAGNFSAELDWAAKKIEAPSEGWGQGVIFTIELDDPEITELQMALIAYPGKGVKVRVKKQGKKVSQPITEFFPIPFASGVFVIERKDNEAIFSLKQNGMLKELTKFACPTADLRYASVWCTRLPKGNTTSDYLFRSLKVSSDSFFSYQVSRESKWSWWQIALILQVCGVGILLAIKYIRRS